MPPCRRGGSALAAVLVVSAAVFTSGCTRDEGPTARPVPIPGSVTEIVDATASSPGIQIDLIVGTDDLVVLRSTATLDTAALIGYRTSEGAVGAEFDSADPPPLTDFGETWFVDGEVFERAPGAQTARRVSGDLADFLFVDSRGTPVNELRPALEDLLEGWPATTVSDAELVDGMSTHHLRFERADGDVVDVWVDERARIVQTVRISERAAPLELRLGFTALTEPPTQPPLPDVEGS